MAKKPKLNFGEGDGHNFFAKHVEKLILAAVAVLVAFFVYRGFSIEGIDPSKSPVQLRDQANNARTNLDKTTWEAVMDQEDRITEEITKRLLERGGGILPTTQDALYQGLAILNPPLIKIKAKRGDPPLLAPEEVELEPGFSAIAMKGSPADDQLMKLGLEARKAAQEDAKKKADAQRKRDEKKLAGSAGGYGAGYPEYGSSTASEGSSYYDTMGGMGGAAPAGPSLTPEQRAYHSSRGYRPANAGGAEMTSYMPTESEAGGYSPSSTEGGYNPYGDSGGYGGSGSGTMGTVPVGKYWITVKALVPYKKQWTEWEHALQDTYDYNPARDVPQYYSYSIERVEVDEAGDVVPKSQKFWNPQTAAWYQQYWYAGVADPILDFAYFDPLLTNPCPPILMRDLEQFQLHSSGKTPKRKIVVREPVKVQARPDAPPPSGDTGPSAAPGPSARGPYAAGSSPYGGSPYGGAAGGYNPYGGASGGYNPYGGAAGGYSPSSTEGYGAAGSEMYGSQYGSTDPYSSGGYGSDASSMYGSSMYGSSMYGSEGSGSAGYGGYGSGGPRVAAPAVDYKLFRFYDFDVVPEKRYKYRVKLYLRDPNHPQAPVPAPPVAYLEEKVADRIRGIDAEDARKTQETGILNQTFWVETEWSQWSPVGEIPPQYRVAAGPVDPARTTQVQPGTEITDPGEEPETSVLAMVFDPAKAADVPGLVTAARGSVLNTKTTANVLHPINLQVFPLPDYDLRTDVLVLDMRGGQDLPTTDKANIDHKAPGEVLLIDSEGNLMVHNELDDILEYQNNIFKEPEKPKVITSDEMMEGYPGSSSAPGYGSPSGGRGKRGRSSGS